MEEIISAEVVESLPLAQCNNNNDNIKVKKSLNQFNYVPECPLINIEFQELGYTVPDLNGKYIWYAIWVHNCQCSHIQQGVYHLY